MRPSAASQRPEPFRAFERGTADADEKAQFAVGPGRGDVVLVPGRFALTEPAPCDPVAAVRRAWVLPGEGARFPSGKIRGQRPALPVSIHFGSVSAVVPDDDWRAQVTAIGDTAEVANRMAPPGRAGRRAERHFWACGV